MTKFLPYIHYERRTCSNIEGSRGESGNGSDNGFCCINDTLLFVLTNDKMKTVKIVIRSEYPLKDAVDVLTKETDKLPFLLRSYEPQFSELGSYVKMSNFYKLSALKSPPNVVILECVVKISLVLGFNVDLEFSKDTSISITTLSPESSFDEFRSDPVNTLVNINKLIKQSIASQLK